MLKSYPGSCHRGEGCLTGLSDEDLSRLPVTCIDGLRDRMEAPAFFSHL